MKVTSKFLTMLQLQDEMNQKVHPEWRSQGFPWHRAIWIECAELMDHHGWKWWKKQSADREQVVLELIDIWHFGLSALLQEGGAPEAIAEYLQNAMEAEQQHFDFLLAVEAFAAVAVSEQKFDAPLFSQLLFLMDISTDHLYRSYVGKNVLNFFRQDHGYKDGSYIKVWSDREDNVHLVEILEHLSAESSSYRDDIYGALAKRYPG